MSVETMVISVALTATLVQFLGMCSNIVAVVVLSYYRVVVEVVRVVVMGMGMGITEMVMTLLCMLLHALLSSLLLLLQGVYNLVVILSTSLLISILDVTWVVVFSWQPLN